jgi:DNA-binding winged helix-turn-helix (wHTH) protein
MGSEFAARDFRSYWEDGIAQEPVICILYPRKAGDRSMDARCFSFGPFVLIPQRQLLLRGDAPVRIGSRALDILTQLVQRPGEIIDKQELIAVVWEGTFVDESNLKVHIAAIRKAIDDETTHRSCIATVIGRGYRFVEPVRKLSFEGSGNPSEEQVPERRLVTIFGAPGVGKTSVAKVVARSIFERRGSRVCFVDLGSVDRHRSDADAVANTLGLEERRGDTDKRLIAAIERGEIVFVFDGRESGIDNITELTGIILSSCPHIRIMATNGLDERSREDIRDSSHPLEQDIAVAEAGAAAFSERVDIASR